MICTQLLSAEGLITFINISFDAWKIEGAMPYWQYLSENIPEISPNHVKI